jgi:hypothetical protein
MQFVISKQIATEADTPEEALAKNPTPEGSKTISMSVNPRPQPAPQQAAARQMGQMIAGTMPIPTQSTKKLQ